MEQSQLFQNFDNTTSYKTIDTLIKKIAKCHLDDLRYLIVKVPDGKNVDKFTAIFHFRNGEGIPAGYNGFKVMG